MKIWLRKIPHHSFCWSFSLVDCNIIYEFQLIFQDTISLILSVYLQWLLHRAWGSHDSASRLQRGHSDQLHSLQGRLHCLRRSCQVKRQCRLVPVQEHRSLLGDNFTSMYGLFSRHHGLAMPAAVVGSEFYIHVRGLFRLSRWLQNRKTDILIMEQILFSSALDAD